MCEEFENMGPEDQVALCLQEELCPDCIVDEKEEDRLSWCHKTEMFPGDEINTLGLETIVGRIDAAQQKRYEDSRKLDKPKKVTSCLSTRPYLPSNPSLIEEGASSAIPKPPEGKKLKSCLKKCTPGESLEMSPEQQLAVTSENTKRNSERSQATLNATRESIQNKDTPKYRPPHLRPNEHGINGGIFRFRSDFEPPLLGLIAYPGGPL